MEILNKIVQFLLSIFYRPTPIVAPEAPVVAPVMPEPPTTPIVPTPQNIATVTNFCLAIKSREGYFPPSRTYPQGTSSWRNNNPGNCKDLNGNFIIFKTYEAGFAYLIDYVKRVQKGLHPAFPPNPSIKEYFEIYAPTSDNNDPLSYAQEVAGKLGVSIDFLIKNLW